jgi:predicted transcriptional regulator
LIILRPSALYLLAAPSTPDEAVAEALERAESGEQITHAEAKSIVAAHRPEVWEIESVVRVVAAAQGSTAGDLRIIARQRIGRCGRSA